jgi:formate dehydrogenase assembly factor FdhD
MTDVISVEEPLEICVTTESDEGYFPSTVAVTMRTPGQDDELGDRFLLTEGILGDPREWRERPQRRPQHRPSQDTTLPCWSWHS